MVSFCLTRHWDALQRKQTKTTKHAAKFWAKGRTLTSSCYWNRSHTPLATDRDNTGTWTPQPFQKQRVQEDPVLMPLTIISQVQGPPMNTFPTSALAYMFLSLKFLKTHAEPWIRELGLLGGAIHNKITSQSFFTVILGVNYLALSQLMDRLWSVIVSLLPWQCPVHIGIG